MPRTAKAPETIPPKLEGRITQHELERLATVRHERKLLEDEEKILRDGIMEKLKVQAPIEEGPYTAEVKVQQVTRFTANKLKAVLDESTMNRLYSEIDKTEEKRLYVYIMSDADLAEGT